MPHWVLMSCQSLLRFYQLSCQSQLAITTDLSLLLSPPLQLCIKAPAQEEAQWRLERVRPMTPR